MLKKHIYILEIQMLVLDIRLEFLAMNNQNYKTLLQKF